MIISIMMHGFQRLKPTKSNLIILKKRVKFAEKGRELLEIKREQLIYQIKDIWVKYKILREQFTDMMRDAYSTLNDTYMDMGKKKVRTIQNFSQIHFQPKITTSFFNIMGIITPKISSGLGELEKLPSYSFSDTSHHLDTLLDKLRDIFEKLISLAELESVLLNYSKNFQKLHRRINSLDKIIILDILNNIKKISDILEENERENMIRLKKIKEIIERERVL